MTFEHGDFIDVAPSVPIADVVTLDRVVCCYPSAEALLTSSAAHARRIVALVYPRDGRFMRVWGRLVNAFLRLKGTPFRTFIHPRSVVEGSLERNGLTLRYRRVGMLWQVVVFARVK